MAVRACACIAVLLIVQACTRESQESSRTPPAPVSVGTKSSLEHRLGWLHSSCLAILDSTLMPGSPVTIVSLGGSEAELIDARIAGVAGASGTCPALLPDRRSANNAKGWSFYEVDLPADAGFKLGVGVVGAITRMAGGIDVSGDGKPDIFTQCATSEGIQFAVWPGHAYQGVPLWSAYYYLGYDTESTCPAGAPG